MKIKNKITKFLSLTLTFLMAGTSIFAYAYVENDNDAIRIEDFNSETDFDVFDVEENVEETGNIEENVEETESNNSIKVLSSSEHIDNGNFTDDVEYVVANTTIKRNKINIRDCKNKVVFEDDEEERFTDFLKNSEITINVGQDTEYTITDEDTLTIEFTPYERITKTDEETGITISFKPGISNNFSSDDTVIIDSIIGEINFSVSMTETDFRDGVLYTDCNLTINLYIYPYAKRIHGTITFEGSYPEEITIQIYENGVYADEITCHNGVDYGKINEDEDEDEDENEKDDNISELYIGSTGSTKPSEITEIEYNFYADILDENDEIIEYEVRCLRPDGYIVLTND